MEMPSLGRAPHDRRSQKPPGAPLPTNQRLELQRILDVLKERLYQCFELAHWEVTVAGDLWSVGAQSAGFQVAEAKKVAGH
jgi:hypothetical protein